MTIYHFRKMATANRHLAQWRGDPAWAGQAVQTWSYMLLFKCSAG